MAQGRYLRDASNPRKEPAALDCMDYWAGMVNRAQFMVRAVRRDWCVFVHGFAKAQSEKVST